MRHFDTNLSVIESSTLQDQLYSSNVQRTLFCINSRALPKHYVQVLTSLNRKCGINRDLSFRNKPQVVAKNQILVWDLKNTYSGGLTTPLDKLTLWIRSPDQQVLRGVKHPKYMRFLQSEAYYRELDWFYDLDHRYNSSPWCHLHRYDDFGLLRTVGKTRIQQEPILNRQLPWLDRLKTKLNDFVYKIFSSGRTELMMREDPLFRLAPNYIAELRRVFLLYHHSMKPIKPKFLRRTKEEEAKHAEEKKEERIKTNIRLKRALEKTLNREKKPGLMDSPLLSWLAGLARQLAQRARAQVTKSNRLENFIAGSEEFRPRNQGKFSLPNDADYERNLPLLTSSRVSRKYFNVDAFWQKRNQLIHFSKTTYSPNEKKSILSGMRMERSGTLMGFSIYNQALATDSVKLNREELYFNLSHPIRKQDESIFITHLKCVEGEMRSEFNPERFVNNLIKNVLLVEDSRRVNLFRPHKPFRKAIETFQITPFIYERSSPDQKVNQKFKKKLKKKLKKKVNQKLKKKHIWHVRIKYTEMIKAMRKFSPKKSKHIFKRVRKLINKRSGYFYSYENEWRHDRIRHSNKPVHLNPVKLPNLVYSLVNTDKYYFAYSFTENERKTLISEKAINREFFAEQTKLSLLTKQSIIREAGDVGNYELHNALKSFGFMTKGFLSSPNPTHSNLNVRFIRRDRQHYTKLKYSRTQAYDMVSGGSAALMAALFGFLITEKFGFELPDSGDFYFGLMYFIFFSWSIVLVRSLLPKIDLTMSNTKIKTAKDSSFRDKFSIDSLKVRYSIEPYSWRSRFSPVGLVSLLLLLFFWSINYLKRLLK